MCARAALGFITHVRVLPMHRKAPSQLVPQTLSSAAALSSSGFYQRRNTTEQHLHREHTQVCGLLVQTSQCVIKQTEAKRCLSLVILLTNGFITAPCVSESIDTVWRGASLNKTGRVIIWSVCSWSRLNLLQMVETEEFSLPVEAALNGSVSGLLVIFEELQKH